MVPHGAPIELYQPVCTSATRRELGLPAQGPLLSTFGLLSRGKGLEQTISALPALVAEWPDLRYVIAGRTHPGVLRHEGEGYRDGLLNLARELGVLEHVVFLDRFLPIDDIGSILAATDAFAAALQSVLRDGASRNAALTAAKNLSASLSWPSVARTLRQVLDDAMHESARADSVTIDRFTAPAPAHTHVRALCDDSAMLQHAALRIPRLEEGYCVDDAARLLPLAARWAREPAESDYWNVTITRMLAFLRAAALGGGGSMRNFMSWNRNWLDEPHDGDHVGRAMWGLGELIREDSHVEEAVELFSMLTARAATTPFSHNLAYTALGIVAADSHAHAMAENLDVVESALSRLRPGQDPAWLWPEAELTYDSARLAEAMIRVGARTNNQQLIADGVAMFRWFERLCTSRGYYRFPGHLGLCPGADLHLSGDEQPLEAAALADAAMAMHLVTDDPTAIMMVERAWSWFNGNNRLGRRLGSVETGAGCDALCEFDVNRNCGAESTISFHRCAATWQDALHRPHKKLAVSTMQ